MSIYLEKLSIILTNFFLKNKVTSKMTNQFRTIKESKLKKNIEILFEGNNSWNEGDFERSLYEISTNRVYQMSPLFSCYRNSTYLPADSCYSNTYLINKKEALSRMLSFCYFAFVFLIFVFEHFYNKYSSTPSVWICPSLIDYI